jgi:hypothetical protein
MIDVMTGEGSDVRAAQFARDAAEALRSLAAMKAGALPAPVAHHIITELAAAVRQIPDALETVGSALVAGLEEYDSWDEGGEDPEDRTGTADDALIEASRHATALADELDGAASAIAGVQARERSGL